MPSTWRCYALTFPEWTFLSDLTTGSSRSYCHCIQRSRLNNVHDYEFNSAIVMVPCTRRKASMQFADACVCWVVNFKPRGAISVRVLTACYEPRRASLRNRTFSSAKAFHIYCRLPISPSVRWILIWHKHTVLKESILSNTANFHYVVITVDNSAFTHWRRTPKIVHIPTSP